MPVETSERPVDAGARRDAARVARRTVLVAAGALAISVGVARSAGALPTAGAWGGFENGRIPPEALARIPWAPTQRLEHRAAAALDGLNAAFRATFGVDLTVTDSYRTFDQQVAVRAAKPGLAAVPGTSNHGWAQALDLGGGINNSGTLNHEWMTLNAPGHGWVNPRWARPRDEGGKGEPWHWEYIGTGAESSVGADPDSDPIPPPEDDMALLLQSSRGFALLDGGSVLPIGDTASVEAYRAAGIKVVSITDADFDRHLGASTSTFLVMNPTRGYAIWSGGKGVPLLNISTVEAFAAKGVPVVAIDAADFTRFLT
ncbi:M15 family metallopeptidase [Cellulomonas fimi]|uniref:D-alanyl-D-alanine carboxypeptidase-like core domain-containing protein n=1 Tax=Cellulomonas fimi TaxID=1708 RepID=A0A7Y0M0W1_CELFI|nr:M15 family metallopeptidase [Cellulomonas fimi]NMR21504.1 hypothetical protein [Cellulomonas fimi]